MVKWTAAVVAGGGIAGLTQGVTGMLRAHSPVLTGGLGNTVIATAELGGALLISFLALAAPAAAVALVILFLLLAIRLLRWLFRGAKSIEQRKMKGRWRKRPLNVAKINTVLKLFWISAKLTISHLRIMVLCSPR